MGAGKALAVDLAGRLLSIVELGVADAAQAQAKAAFGGDAENMPTAEIPADTATVADVLVAAKAAKSKSEARRLIEGGGVKIDEEKIDDVNAEIPASAKEKGEFILHKGKKVHIRVLLLA